MELYGSLSNISGSVSASVFTGSYIGDGAGLYNLPASGVVGLNLSQIATGSVSASLSPDGFNVNTDTSITGSLIVSGDTQISGALTASGLIYPTTDGGERTFLQSDGNGNLTLHYVESMVEPIFNGESFTLQKGTPVYVSGSQGADPIVYVADAANPNKMPVIYIVDENLESGQIGIGILLGKIEGVNTTGYSPGTEVFVAAGGGWTSTRPTGSGIVQSLGIVTKEGNGGQGIILNPGPNSLPNIATNKLWIGDTNSYPIEKTIDEIGLATTSSLTSLSSSVAQTDLNQNGRLNSIEGVTGSYATTGSNLFIGTQTISGSILPSVDNEYDLGSPTYQWRDVYISSGSLYIDGTKVISSTAQELTITTDTGQSIKILEGTTDSIILQTADGDIELKSSADGDILLDPTNGKIMLKGTIEVFNGNKIQSSVGGTPVVFANDIVVSGSIELTGTVDGIDLTAFSSSINTRVSDLESGAGSLNAFTASASGRLNSLETESGSIRTNFNSYTSSTDGRLNSIETTTGSIITTNTAQGGRLDSIESKTGSYATTGSNNFFGSQYITGSLTISDNLTVLGSSSIVYSTASQLIVEDNVIVVNSSFPAERFAGLEVHDSGSNGSVTASLFWDGLNNRWIYQNTSEAHYGGGMFIAGPRNTGSLGDEPGLTNGTIPKSIGGDHIGDSIISEFSGSIAINGGLIITGSILSNVSPLVSGSSQISFNGISDKPTLVSGSGQISFNGITDKPTLVSGSSQISFNNISDKPTLVSGSAQISFNSITDKPTLVSGSSQIDLTATTNYSSGIKTRLNAENVISGSAQVVASLPVGTVSGSAQITFSGISSKPTTLSGYGITDALSNDSDSEQDVGGRHFRFNHGTNRINIDPRWNESGYDADMGVFHMYSTTAAGVQWGRTGLALYNGSAYQYLTTKDGQNHLYINNNIAIHAGNISSYAVTSLTDTLATVTARGATTSTAVTFTGTLTVNTNANQVAYFQSPNANTWVDIISTAGTWSMGATSSNTWAIYERGSANATRFSVGSSAATLYGNTVWHAGNDGSSSGLDSDLLDGYHLEGATSVATRIFNNKGQVHNTYTNFNTAMTPGPNYLQQGTNGPTGTASHQWYGFMFGLGGEYGTTTGTAGHYASQLYYSRIGEGGGQYLWARDMESGTWGSWRKLHAGYADTAGNITAYTINQNLGTTNTVTFGNLRVGSAGSTNGGLVNITGANDNQVNITHDSSWGLLLGYCNEGSPSGYHGPNHAAIINVRNASLHFGINNSSNVQISSGGHFHPSANNTYDCGTSSLAWRNVYTNDLHLSNMNKPEGNDVDGTNGNWTIQEGAENLYIINNNNGKKFKISLEEIK